MALQVLLLSMLFFFVFFFDYIKNYNYYNWSIIDIIFYLGV